MTYEKVYLGEVEAWRWLVACFIDGESTNSKLKPFANAPTLANWERRGAATKELEEAAEGLGRASRVSRSGLNLAICKDPLGGNRKKTRRGTQLRTSNARRVVRRCLYLTNKSLLDAPS